MLGCTLQSFITPECEQIVQSRIQDFRRIGNWTIADHNAEHKTDVKWLKANIEQIRANTPRGTHQIIVVTHHAPVRSGSSKPEHERNPWSDAFATGLLDVGQNQKDNPLQAVNCWIFGHTHFSTQFYRGHVQIVSNQRGYDLGQDRGLTDNLKEEHSKSQSKFRLFKMLGFLGVRPSSNTRQQALGPQKSFDIRKCIDL